MFIGTRVAQAMQTVLTGGGVVTLHRPGQNHTDRNFRGLGVK